MSAESKAWVSLRFLIQSASIHRTCFAPEARRKNAHLANREIAPPAKRKAKMSNTSSPIPIIPNLSGLLGEDYGVARLWNMSGAQTHCKVTTPLGRTLAETDRAGEWPLPFCSETVRQVVVE